jgi:hypothetical protein
MSLSTETLRNYTAAGIQAHIMKLQAELHALVNGETYVNGKSNGKSNGRAKRKAAPAAAPAPAATPASAAAPAPVSAPAATRKTGKRTMSAEARQRIADAQKRRWAGHRKAAKAGAAPASRGRGRARAAVAGATVSMDPNTFLPE